MSEAPTIWGLSPLEVHDRFWASRGVQVVRPNEPSAIVPFAELYLLVPSGSLVLFRLAPLLDTLAWIRPDLVALRLLDSDVTGYSETVRADAAGRFLRFDRLYGSGDSRTLRVGLATDPGVAEIWQAATDHRTGWQRLRRSIRRSARHAARLRARIFLSDQPREPALFLREMARRWRRPDAVIEGIAPAAPGIFGLEAGLASAPADAVGPLWIGAGRSIPAGSAAMGPAVLTDDPAHRPSPSPVQWADLEPVSDSLARATTPKIARRPLKRPFDILFSLVVLAFTLPLYPFIALAIFLEDGRPIFFSHRRETIGGRTFGCIKFRSMRRDAEAIKAGLAAANRADGPQFFIPDDPRLTRVGKILRDFQLDELPQFINVLRGDMAVVGPRPSPFKENQYCPAWREARLSVRPGVTGLWQIRRTRAEGTDFQEWIKYDIEYVDRESFLLDFVIIWSTILMIIRKVSRL